MNPKNRNLLIGGVAGILVLCCCCVVAVGILVVADPFGWGLLNFLPGRGESISAAIPADAPLYTTLDVTALASPKTARILKAFADVANVSDYSSSDKINSQLDKNLQDSLGLSFTNDILPWVGRYAGLSVSKLPANASDYSGMDVALMVEARNTKAAGDFVTKFVNALANKSGTTPTETQYKGVTIHTVPQSSGQPVVVALSKGLVLWGQNESAIQSAIDAQTGATPSAANAAAYKNLRRQLPSDSLLILMANGPALQTYVQEVQRTQGGLSSTFNSAQTGLKAVQAMGIALSAADAGVRLDTAVAWDEAQLSDTERQYYSASGDDQTASFFPDNTLLYVAGQRLDLAWAIFREAMPATDFKDAMTSFETTFGFNPDTALIPYVQRGFGMVLMPDADSPLAKAGTGNIGYAMLVGTNDAQALGQTLTTFNSGLEKQGLKIDARTVGGQEAYVLNSGSQALAVYGIAKDYLAVASSEQAFSNLFSNGSSLAKAAGYQKVWQAFPTGMRHVFYADVTGMVDLARQSLPGSSLDSFDKEVQPYLKPVTAVAVGASPLKNGVAQSTLIVFIEGGK